jgi:high-affinity Fe2+/Pb2+ permease
MPLDPEQLDLSKSADSQEQFRTKRLIPWEAAPLLFYIAAMIGCALALRGIVLVDALKRFEVMIAVGLVILLGMMIALSSWKIRNIKNDNDYRRALLVSVLEGENSANIITDKQLRTIYANKNVKP